MSENQRLEFVEQQLNVLFRELEQFSTEFQNTLQMLANANAKGMKSLQAQIDTLKAQVEKTDAAAERSVLPSGERAGVEL
jgi:SMC interacting uncharacterized protein involved in chromosome segregation